MNDPTKRFSDRVDHYVKYRPHYPTESIRFLERHHGINDRMVVVDVGSGTGISSELFLQNGNRVFGVEPNKEMRMAGEDLLAVYRQFTCVDGTAEATTLPDGIADVVVAGQAFHWFDRARAKVEFKRIAKKEALAVLLWNDRTESTPFMQRYEALVREMAVDYHEVNHKNIDESVIRDFFGPREMEYTSFGHNRLLTLEGLQGLLQSASYMPHRLHPEFARMMEQVRGLFEEFENAGVVTIEYITRMYCGRIH